MAENPDDLNVVVSRNMCHEGSTGDKQNGVAKHDIAAQSLDYISGLPVDVIHKIFSLLSGKDMVSMSALSKTWYLWVSSYPILHFNFYRYLKDSSRLASSTEEMIEFWCKFVDVVDQSTMRLCSLEQELSRGIFCLCLQKNFDFSPLNHPSLIDFYDRFNRWLMVVASNNIREVYLHLQLCPWLSQWLHALSSSKSLTVLQLSGCYFQDQKFADIPKLSHLQQLFLMDVSSLSDKGLSSLLYICPSIRNLSLVRCCGLRNIRLTHHIGFKSVRVVDCKVDKIEIGATTLHTFHYSEEKSKEMEININACKSLEVLYLNCRIVPKGLPSHICSQFPILKTLFLGFCDSLKSVVISSNLLERLTLVNTVDLVDATIDTPNLQSFEYHGNLCNWKSFTFSNGASGICQSTLYPSDPINKNWFLYLSRFLVVCRNGTLSIIVSDSAYYSAADLRVTPVPLKHLAIKVKGFQFSIVDGLLWCSRPDTLSFEWSKCPKYKVIEEFFAHFFPREGALIKCCKTSRIKCWKHYLEDVQFDDFAPNDGEVAFASYRKIRLTFKWRPN